MRIHCNKLEEENSKNLTIEKSYKTLQVKHKKLIEKYATLRSQMSSYTTDVVRKYLHSYVCVCVRACVRVCVNISCFLNVPYIGNHPWKKIFVNFVNVFLLLFLSCKAKLLFSFYVSIPTKKK